MNDIKVGYQVPMPTAVRDPYRMQTQQTLNDLITQSSIHNQIKYLRLCFKHQDGEMFEEKLQEIEMMLESYFVACKYEAI